MIGALNLFSLPQKFLLGGLGAALIAAGSYNVVQLIEIRGLKDDKVKLDTRINDPKTGFVVRLTQSETNTAVCTTAVQRQNVVIRDQSARSVAQVASVQRLYDVERIARIRAERDVGSILARKPQGATVTDRVLDVDHRILEDLK